MTVRMLQRRGTATQWNGVGGTVVLDEGEVGVNTTDNSFKIGDGSTPWNGLEYHYPDNLNEAKYVQLVGGNTVSGNQGLTGNQTITGNLSVTGATTLTGQTSVVGATSVTGVLNVNNNLITNVALPTEAHHAANRQYVDDTVAGLAWKDAVHLLSVSNVALTGLTNTLQIDGHDALVAADNELYRILLTAQTNAVDNGIYVYFDDGTNYELLRAEDANPVSELHGASVYVQEGTAYGTSSWVQSNYNAAEYDELVWVQFSGVSLIDAGAGLSKTGKALNINVTANRTAIVDDAVDIASNYAGQTSIITVSDTTGITTGTWNADTIDIEHGGTGATTAEDARTNLQLGDSAIANIGTTYGSVAAGDHTHDSRYYTKALTDELLLGYVSLGSSSTISGTLTAHNYDVSISVEASNSIALNFSGGTGIHTRAMTGDITFTASNYRAGATKTLFITSDSSVRNLTFPSGWIWVSPKPSTIAASKTGVLTVTSLGTAEANAVASWAVQV